MKINREQGRIVTIWKEYFHDCGCKPPKWKSKSHPHDRYKLGGRIFLAFVGSLVLVLPTLLLTGITRKLDEGSLPGPFTVVAVSVTLLILWIAPVLLAAYSEQKRPSLYFFAGMSPPAWGLLVIRTMLDSLK